MRRIVAMALALGASCMASGAWADVTLNSVRVGAKDPAAVAKFYEAAFGMQEVNRLNLSSGPEIFLSFGATVDAAKANRAPRIVIMPRADDDFEDPIAHVIFSVTDIASTTAAVKAAGGTMSREPYEYQNTGIMIGFAVDPAGNEVELIQSAQR